MKFPGPALPLDVLRPILDELTDRRDLRACVLVSRTFHRVATPLLYAVLDARVLKNPAAHPSATLLQCPHLAKYVRHITETAAVHRCHPDITEHILRAHALCTNLRSMTWIDDLPCPASDGFFLSLISIVRHLPLRCLTVRTHSDLADEAWAQLTTLTGLQKISIWCLEAPPFRLRDGWTDRLRNTLTHLELGVMLSGLVMLQDLRLKGAPSTAIPTILALLPNLRTLDTEYLVRRAPPIPLANPRAMAALRHLTVRTSSSGSPQLWAWITMILPRAGLETLKLHVFTLHHLGHTRIPRTFLRDLATHQADSLVHFLAGDAELALADVAYLCAMFPRLESLECLVVASDVAAIAAAVEKAVNLRTLRLRVQWRDAQPPLTLEQARYWMLRDDSSLLRVVGINSVVYIGKWILDPEGDLKFEVVPDAKRDKWNT
ncbi:hypothetical protein GGX14DRAFT_609006 [Mycena pura]|uniref:F-box domain-containing protein n=1 Tax=Mycena pura TaxID=153505 RepID=A0AAD6XVP5_9AGAR|nr:hypothetical protein GGX14DRAFT_609006 [Mycena pura]